VPSADVARSRQLPAVVAHPSRLRLSRHDVAVAGKGVSIDQTITPSDLPSWRDGATRETIVAFVESAVRDIPPAERVATFDNDGTLWCEKPMPIELMFILQRLAAMADKDE
jgi:hypothetical protein